jgi:hypothetical protein
MGSETSVDALLKTLLRQQEKMLAQIDSMDKARIREKKETEERLAKMDERFDKMEDALERVLAMTSVLATVSLFFSAAHHLCRHSLSPLRFMFCF